MIGYLDAEYVEEIDAITHDQTIGIVRYVESDHLTNGVTVDINRLRRALIAFEEEYRTDYPLLTVVDGDGPRSVVLTESEDSGAGVMLAGRVKQNTLKDRGYRGES